MQENTPFNQRRSGISATPAGSDCDALRAATICGEVQILAVGCGYARLGQPGALEPPEHHPGHPPKGQGSLPSLLPPSPSPKSILRAVVCELADDGQGVTDSPTNIFGRRRITMDGLVPSQIHSLRLAVCLLGDQLVPLRCVYPLG